MKLVSKSKNLVTLELSNRELIILNNSLNEVCNALDLHDMDDRIGANMDESKYIVTFS